MLHPETELRKIDDEIGYGVFATRFIPQGTITWALDPLDQVLDDRRMASVGEDHDGVLARYTWVNAQGHRILCWDFARYMNHSCEANSFGPGGFDFEIAVRGIAAGEQLTSDYGALNIEAPLSCRCGSPHCRGIVRPADFENLAPVWDRVIRAAFPLIRQVEQPLWKWVAQYERAIERAVLDPGTVPSILNHRWVPAPPTRLGRAIHAAGGRFPGLVAEVPGSLARRGRRL